MVTALTELVASPAHETNDDPDKSSTTATVAHLTATGNTKPEGLSEWVRERHGDSSDINANQAKCNSSTTVFLAISYPSTRRWVRQLPLACPRLHI